MILWGVLNLFHLSFNIDIKEMRSEAVFSYKRSDLARRSVTTNHGIGNMLIGKNVAVPTLKTDCFGWSCLAGLLLLLLTSCGVQKVKVVYVPLEQRQRTVAIVCNPQELNSRLCIARSQLLRKHLERWRGTPYRFGGSSPRGVDCSGFVQLTYQRLFHRDLPRTVDDQVRFGQKVALNSAQPGDLVFFKTGIWQRHVGIYMGNGQFMHASESQGVTVSSLSDNYWQENYWQMKRMLPDGGQG